MVKSQDSLEQCEVTKIAKYQLAKNRKSKVCGAMLDLEIALRAHETESAGRCVMFQLHLGNIFAAASAAHNVFFRP